MCGIVAVIGGFPEDRAVVTDRLLAGVAHRGPDDLGRRHLEGASLAAARLAILDPRRRASQPMSAEDHHLVYNGEVYNCVALRSELKSSGWRFATTGDTEVVLAALVRWGPLAIRRFAGMYAFALWNEKRRELWVGRDRSGIKPLYAGRLRADLFAICSEASPLAAQNEASVSLDAVREFLRFGAAISTPIWHGLTEIEPGNSVIFGLDGVEKRRWQLGSSDSRSASATRGPGEPFHPEVRTGDVAQEGYAALGQRFMSGVARHLLADRSTALFLSGGFDSAALAAGAVRAGSKPSGLTLAVAGNEPEVARAQATASHYGLPHRVVDLADTEAQGRLGDFLTAMDQPTVDGFNTFLISSIAADAGFPVALSGLGGDEILGGYGYYRRWRQLLWARSIWRCFPDPVRRAAAFLVGRRFARSTELVAGILDAATPAEVYHAWRSLFSATEVARLTGADAVCSQGRATEGTNEPVGRQLRRLDAESYLAPVLLRDSDVFSMANGVELRVPFLDDAFVEAALSGKTPAEAGTGSGGGVLGLPEKVDLAQALGDDWLEGLARAPKLPFSLPWRRWLGTPDDVVGGLKESDPWGNLIDPVEARRLLASEPQWANPLRRWALVVLAAWLARPPTKRHLTPRRLAGSPPDQP